MSEKGADQPTSALIFKVNQLGDNVVFLPVIERIVADAIFEKLTLWTTPTAASLYEQLAPKLNLEVITRQDFYPAWRNPRAMLRLIQLARSSRPQITLVAEDMGNTAYLLSLLSGAKHRVGTRPAFLKIPLAVNHEIQLQAYIPAAEKAWKLGRSLVEISGGCPWPASPPPPDLTHLVSGSQKRFDIVIHAGASRGYQRWSLARYVELANRLSNRFRVGWFEMAENEPVPSAPGILLRSNSLGDMVSHLSEATIFVGNNSGPMNLASALGIPSVILVGPSARTWDPYWFPERFRILRHESLPCIACDPPGLPIREICTNSQCPMACMKFWSVDRVETEVMAWHQKWSAKSLN